jgi:hypothetical protein
VRGGAINASSTKPKTLVDYIENAGILAEDKCRSGTSSPRKLPERD